MNNALTTEVFGHVALAAPRRHATARGKRVAPVPDRFVRAGPLLPRPRRLHPSILYPIGSFHRLRIMHHWLYPDALLRATVVLDTFPYGGCLTVLEVSSLNPRTYPCVWLIIRRLVYQQPLYRIYTTTESFA